MLRVVRALTVVPGRAGSGAVRAVPDPQVGDGEALIDVVRVGCGTEAETRRASCRAIRPRSRRWWR